jgi:hypothetical protein
MKTFIILRIRRYYEGSEESSDDEMYGYYKEMDKD